MIDIQDGSNILFYDMLF